jgi:hypothetical protein
MYDNTIANMNVDPQGVMDEHQGYAEEALAAINDAAGRLVEFSTAQLSVTVPDQVSQGIDFDMSQEALARAQAGKPVAPTIDPLTPEEPAEPAIDAPVITDVESYAEGLRSALYAKLLADIQNGTYGIDPADEAALWQRARDRETLGMRDAIEQATEEYAAMGWSIPPGALKKGIDKIRKASYDNLGALNRDIIIKRADLYRDARKFAIEQVMALEKLLLDTITARINAANLVVQKYMAQLKSWENRLELLKTNNQLTLEAYKSDIDAYRADLQGITASFELGQKAREDQYRALVSALAANSEAAKIAVSQVVEQAKLRQAGTAAIADVYKNIAAAAIGATHVSLGLSASQSYQQSFGITNHHSTNSNTNTNTNTNYNFSGSIA